MHDQCTDRVGRKKVHILQAKSMLLAGNCQVEASTIDRAQGREFDLVILGITRRDTLGFLRDRGFSA
jgi:hypothetical protein